MAGHFDQVVGYALSLVKEIKSQKPDTGTEVLVRMLLAIEKPNLLSVTRFAHGVNIFPKKSR
jgi:hypothetical protein